MQEFELTKQNVIKIETLTFDYDEMEDRILVSANLYNHLDEINFWLTRKLTLKLLDAGAGLIKKTSPVIAKTPAEHKAAMALFEHQNAEQSAATHSFPANISKENSIELSADPSVLTRLDIGYKAKQYKFSFFIAKQDDVIAISLINCKEFHQILALIHKGALHLNWGVQSQLFMPSDNEPYTLQ